jgi:hypothetical protein
LVNVESIQLEIVRREEGRIPEGEDEGGGEGGSGREEGGL